MYLLLLILFTIKVYARINISKLISLVLDLQNVSEEFIDKFNEHVGNRTASVETLTIRLLQL